VPYHFVYAYYLNEEFFVWYNQVMSEDEFTKLFKYMSERIGKIDKTLEEKSSSADMQRVLELLDELAKRVEISDDERLVMAIN
jgi:uncharacterized protein involved in tolerance to divalent cations